jgi:hypothetical protein
VHVARALVKTCASPTAAENDSCDDKAIRVFDPRLARARLSVGAHNANTVD